MRQRWAILQLLVLVFTGAWLAGCPTQTATLVTSRDSISFGEDGTSASFTIRNTGAATLTWTVEEVVRASADAPWVPQDIPWLTVDPTSGSTNTEMDRVNLTATREALPVATFQNTGVRVNSNGGVKVIPVSIIVAPTLTVSPATVPLAPTATFAEFTISNSGSETVSWEILFLPDPNNTANPQPLPAGINVEPNPGSTAPGGNTVVNVTFEEGQEDFALVVQSERGGGVVSFLFGAALEGLEISPSPLRLYVNTGTDGEPGRIVASPLHITNTRGVPQSWTLEAVSRTNPGTPPPIGIDPGAGTTPANSTSDVAVSVTNVETVETGSGFYDIILRSGENFLIVPVIVEIVPLPEIVLSEPPEDTSGRPEISQINVLDFGRESIQGIFYVANIGPRGSRLQFRITHEDQGVEIPLIASVQPLQGDTNGSEEIFFHPPGSNLLIDAQEVIITIDRSAMVEEVEERVLTVTAYDEDFLAPLEVVEPVELRIRVERPPLKVQGAINRGRPPFLDKWVFLLRDDLGQVIPTTTPEDRDRLNFRVTENDVELDLDETNQFIDGPEGLKVNLVLMLDYTGSMFLAGTTNPTNPLEPGEAIEQVNEAAKDFLDDLPESWQVAIMYYNDRQQRNHVIAPFSTDRGSLKAALDAFSLPASQHGVSAINDALMAAVELLAAEDPSDTLPFDDADVRAIVYVTDGRETGSITDTGQVVDEAREQRVQLYPLGYSAGGNNNSADMLTMAEDTGGHAYSAGHVTNLARLLGNDKALALEPADPTAANSAFFRVANIGQTALPWSIEIEEGIDWITSVSPSSGTTNANGSTLVRVNLDPTRAPASRLVEGKLFISSGNGSGEVTVTIRTAADNSIVSMNVELEDEPGRVWAELRNQVVFSYLTPLQDAGVYQIFVRYTKPDNENIQGMFEEDGVFFPGDIYAGQIALRTSGIMEDPRAAAGEEALSAEVFVRAEYVPRGVNRFRLRFFKQLPEDAPAGAQAALDAVGLSVSLAEDGLLVPEDEFDATWRLVSAGDGIYVMLTEEENPLPYGAFGNLLRITFTNLQPYVDLFNGAGRAGEFLLGMRVDNDIYFAPETPGTPSQTKYFLYPGGQTFPDRMLLVSQASPDLAPPARNADLLQNPGIDPEAPFAFDRDEDDLPDFQDPSPENDEQPGDLVRPQRIELDPGVDTGILVVRNNRFDSFNWTIDETSVPDWIEITFDSPTPRFTLGPGEAETVNVTVDRSGLPGGFNTANIRFDFNIFEDQVVPVVAIVAK